MTFKNTFMSVSKQILSSGEIPIYTNPALSEMENSAKYPHWWIVGIKPGREKHPATHLESYFLYLCLSLIQLSFCWACFKSDARCPLRASVCIWTRTFKGLLASAAWFIWFLLFTLKLFEFRSIFRGGKEPCCWVDLVSTSIRELIINHGCSTQRDAVGVTVFVCLGA